LPAQYTPDFFMSIIYFIRHGQASFGEKNYDRLSELGVRQAEILGDYLQQINMTFDRIYSGSLDRQTATARAVISRLADPPDGGEPRILPAFDEYDTYSIFMNHVAEMTARNPELARAVENMFADRRSFKQVYRAILKSWAARTGAARTNGGWGDFRQRIRAGIEQLRAENGPGKRLAVFTSGGPVAATVQLALDLADEQAIFLPRLIRNASISTFLYDDRRFSLSSYNSVSHLELRNDPALITFL
jgi:broad specificity phosphatase PhoE